MRISAEFYSLRPTSTQKKSAFDHSAEVSAVRAKVSLYLIAIFILFIYENFYTKRNNFKW
jgi:hypothetical protein